MRSYKASVSVSHDNNKRVVPTEIRAASQSDAKWLLQAIYGFHAVVSGPIEVSERVQEADGSYPKTPEQAKIASLKAAKDRANDALKAERDRQKRQRALKTLRAVATPN